MFLLLVALLGHLGFWVALLNRTHSVGIPRSLVNLLTAVELIVLSALPIAALAAFWFGWIPTSVAQGIGGGSRWIETYLILCWIIAPIVVLGWLRRIAWESTPPLLIANHTRHFDIAKRLGHRPIHGLIGRSLSYIPWNQSFKVQLQEKTLEIPRLDARLDGLTILHLSDFHWTGRMGKEFYAEVSRLAVEAEPDLIALTGDFIDAVDCIDWVREVFGPLKARHGIYYVLGNHDVRAGQLPRLRGALASIGAVDLGGRWITVEINGAPLVLAGNELPWIAPAANMANCPREVAGRRLPRVLLAHTPDAWRWAVEYDIDLMLAGHTHGGQICLPGIGPIFCPSRYGVNLAAGVFQKPPTLLHVTRGVAGEFPIRWHCPPEIARLTLRSGQTS
jgi:hypothetical protein